MKLDEFISAIFGNVNGSVIGLAWPNNGAGWTTRKWVKGLTREPLGSVYYCISTLKPCGRQLDISRRLGDCVQTYVIVLDDVGTKIPRERVTLPPTYVMETSEGNFQYGYKLTSPIDPEQGQAVIQALIRAGLTDAGSHSVNRVMRVPGSLNTKRGNWRARLVHSDWSVTYAWHELTTGLDAPITEPEVAWTGAEGEPDPADPVYQWLVAEGHVLKPSTPGLRRGWAVIRCPWEHLHTEVNEGTGYFPSRPNGAFKCLHGHCAERRTSDLKAWARDGGYVDPPEVNRSGLEALAAALRPALERATPSALFQPPPSVARSERLAIRLVEHISEVALRPDLLHDYDVLPNGVASRSQAATQARIEWVAERIGLVFKLNVINQQAEVSLAGWEGEPIDLNHAVGLLVHACVRCGMKDQASVRDALDIMARSNPYSPALDWIASKPWDGQDRIVALAATLVMKDPKLNGWRDMALRRWLLQCVVGWENWKYPPEQLGLTLVLQGDQGIGKSRWVSALMPAASGWIAEGIALHLDSNERDSVSIATSSLITELAELDVTYRKSDIAALRNFLTRSVDRYRPPYGRTHLILPRMTSFIASVNPEGFLVDNTGERRYLPLGLARVVINHGIDLQQLWAQVWQLADEEQHWLTKAEEAVHKKVVAEHTAENELTHVMEDIDRRRAAFKTDPALWRNTRTVEIFDKYGIKKTNKNYVDINSMLALAGYTKTRIHGGVRVWNLPDIFKAINPTMKSGFQLLDGGKK